MSNGQQFVVKRFFKIDEDDATVVTASAHNTQIQAEIGRLALAKWFFDAFIKHCANSNVIIDESVYFLADIQMSLH